MIITFLLPDDNLSPTWLRTRSVSWLTSCSMTLNSLSSEKALVELKSLDRPKKEDGFDGLVDGNS